MEEKSIRRRTLLVALFVVVLAAFLISNWSSFSSSLSGDSSAWLKDSIELQDGRVFTAQEIEFLSGKLEQQDISVLANKEGRLQVARQDRERCNAILRSEEFTSLKKNTSSSQGFLPRSFISPSEQSRLAMEEKLERLRSILKRMQGIRDAIIVYDQAKGRSFQRDSVHSSVVTLWASENNLIQKSHAVTAKQLVLYAFAGLKKETVLVIDGDSGKIFAALDEIPGDPSDGIHSRDIAIARQAYIEKCELLLQEFGTSQIQIQLFSGHPSSDEQTDKEIPLEVPATNTFAKRKPSSNLPNEKIEAVPNGTGKIFPRTPRSKPGLASVDQSTPATTGDSARDSVLASHREFDSPNDPRPNAKSSALKLHHQIASIKISMQEKEVKRYLREKMQTGAEVTRQQFSRGVVTVRNEVTKKIVATLRKQAVIIDAQRVSFEVVLQEKVQQAARKDSKSAVPKKANFPVSPLFLTFAAIGMAGLIWKKSSKAHRRKNPERYSADGRNFVSRNMATTGSVLTDEIREVIQTKPEHSKRVFQDLVQGSSNA